MSSIAIAPEAPLATMSVSAFAKHDPKPFDLDHYTVAAYDSTETMNLRIVVIVPDVTEPTWILRPRARSARRSNIMALALPNLDALTLALARRLTHIGTDYIVVRECLAEARAKNKIQPGRAVRMPWNH